MAERSRSRSPVRDRAEERSARNGTVSGRRGCRAVGLRTEAIFVGPQVKASQCSDSDHNPILFKFSDESPDAKPLTLLSWNILCKYGYNEKFNFPFDGYCRRSEADDAYIGRLKRAVKEIVALVKSESVDAVLLQECADVGKVGHGIVADELSAELSPQGYTILHSGEFVTAVRGSCENLAAAAEGLKRQSGKVHVVYASSLGTVLVNVHLAYDQRGSPKEGMTRSELETLFVRAGELHPGAQVILAGDTNRVPAELPPDSDACVDATAATIESLTDGLGILAHPPGPTNVRWSGPEKGSEMTYADFALWVAPQREPQV